jgi:hypothetical protein
MPRPRATVLHVVDHGDLIKLLRRAGLSLNPVFHYRGRAMAATMNKTPATTFLLIPAAASLVLLLAAAASVEASAFDYAGAFDKCLLFFEAQRSGKLPDDRLVRWRGDSALTDGFSQGVIHTSPPPPIQSTKCSIVVTVIRVVL